MKQLIDITRELLSCEVFPGDPSPEMTPLLRMADGGACNLSRLSMCLHNGTHVDAPYHFIPGGKTISQIPPGTFTGECFLARREGDVTAADAEDILRKARAAGAAERILIAGPATVTREAAEVFAGAGILLLGNESQTVGPADDPGPVHLALLGAGAVLLEGVVLTGLEEGKYFLNAAPLKIAGADGAPCRAWLMR